MKFLENSWKHFWKIFDLGLTAQYAWLHQLLLKYDWVIVKVSIGGVTTYDGIKQYDSTVQVGIGAIVERHQKYHLKKKHFLHNKNYLYGIVLVHIANVAFKTRKHFQTAGYWIF